MARWSKRRSTVILAFAVASTGCAEGRSEHHLASRVDSAGVSIVTIRAGDGWELPWHFEAAWSVGGVDDPDLSLASLNANQVAADEAGNVYVVDGAGHRILVLGPSGELAKVLGSEGDGPDEFTTPLGLALDTGGVLSIYDIGRGAIARWGVDGSSLDSEPLPGLAWSGQFEPLAGGLLFLDQGMTDREVPVQRLTRIVDGETEVLVTKEGLPSKPADFPSCGLQGVLVPPLFNPDLVWTSRAPLAAVSAGSGYEIQEFRGGRPTRIVRWDRPLLELNDRIVVESLEGGWFVEPINCTIPAEEAVRGRGYAEYAPVIAALRYDPLGRLWVRRDALGRDAGLVDVLDSEGEYLGTLPPGSPFPAAFVTPTSFVAIGTDSLDVPVLTRYSFGPS